MVSRMSKKHGDQIPTRLSWNPGKTLGKQANRAKELRRGIHPPAALLNRGLNILQGHFIKLMENRLST